MPEGTGPHPVFVVHTQLAFRNTIYLSVKKAGTLFQLKRSAYAA